MGDLFTDKPLMRIPWKNTDTSYGLIAMTLHWLVAVAIAGMFAFGLWMTELTLYDAWYRRAPALHKSVGVVLFTIMVLRTAWRCYTPAPRFEPCIPANEARAARAAHFLLYLLPFLVMFSGYLISTADGRPVEVFGLFAIPATISGIDKQEDIAGAAHLILASALMALAALHALAALKHHFIDHDRTLLRMIGLNDDNLPQEKP